MDLEDIVNKAVEDAAKELEVFLPKIVKGVEQALAYGSWDIVRMKIDSSMQKIVNFADANNNADLLKNIKSSMYIESRLFTLNHVKDSGKQRLAAFQLYSILKYDGTYADLILKVNALEKVEAELRKLANKPDLFADVDDPKKYLGKSKLVETQSGLGAEISEMHEEWYLNQAVLLEAMEKASTEEIKRRLTVMMLQSFNKAAKVAESASLGYITSPFSDKNSKSLFPLAPLYHRSDAVHKLIGKLQVSLNAKMALGAGWYYPRFIHNITFKNVVCRAFSFEDVAHSVSSTGSFKTEIKKVMQHIVDGTVLTHPLAIDVSALYVVGEDTLGNELEALYCEARDEFIIEHKLKCALDAAPTVLLDSELEAIEVEVRQKFSNMKKHLFALVFTQYTPDAPVLAEALESADAAPAAVAILQCGKEVTYPSIKPNILLVGPVEPMQDKYFNPTMDIVLIPKQFLGGQDILEELEHSIIHSGYRLDPLQTKKYWAASKDYKDILKESDIELTKISHLKETVPIVCKDFKKLLAHSSATNFKKLADSEEPYIQILAKATFAMLKGIEDFEYTEVSRVLATVSKSGPECEYTGTLALEPAGAKAYKDALCTEEQTLNAEAMPSDPLNLYVKRPADENLEMTFTLASTNDKAVIADPATKEPFSVLEEADTRCGIDKSYESKGLMDLLQTSYYRIMNAMAAACTSKDNLVKFLNQIEILNQELVGMLSILEPHEDNVFETAINSFIESVIPSEVRTAKIHLKPSAMHCLSSLSAGVEAAVGTRKLKVLFLDDCYYEESFAMGEWKNWKHFGLSGDTKEMTVEGVDLNIDTVLKTDDRWNPAKGLHLFICDQHHNISMSRNEYKVEALGDYIQALYDKELVADKFTVAIDATMDLIRSTDIEALLEKFKSKIVDGTMNVVVFRSAQKFDMLGLDNYYGGYTMSFNKETDWSAFTEVMDAPEDQLGGLNRQGLSHIAKYTAPSLDAYRKALIASTKKIYDLLDPECVYQNPDDIVEDSPVPGHMIISKIVDPKSVFLDIKFPAAQIIGDDLNKLMNTLYDSISNKLQNFALENKIPLTQRASFGFPTTNLSQIEGVKIRLNPGLDKASILEDYAAFLNYVHSCLKASDLAKDDLEYVVKLTELIKGIDISNVEISDRPKEMTKEEIEAAEIDDVIDVERGKPTII